MEAIPCADSVSTNVNNLEDLEQSYANSNGDTYNTCEDGGNALNRVLHIKDFHVLALGSSALSDTGKIYNSEEKTSEELKLHQANSIATSKKTSMKCATFPSTGSVIMCAVSTEEKDDLADTKLCEKSTTESGNSVLARPISMPLKFVSAMKGGREKQGMPQKKLTVKWALDVYNPPATSMSHTVKNHNHQHSKSSKKKGKHKHRGKSSRGNGSDKKQHRKISGNIDSRLKLTLPCDKFFLGDISKSNVELLEFSVNGQDTKCGSSSFLGESISKLHISVAEVT